MSLGPRRYFTIALLSFQSVVNPVYIKMLIVFKIVVWRKSTIVHVMVRLKTIGSVYGFVLIESNLI